MLLTKAGRARNPFPRFLHGESRLGNKRCCNAAGLFTAVMLALLSSGFDLSAPIEMHSFVELVDRLGVHLDSASFTPPPAEWGTRRFFRNGRCLGVV